MSLWIGIAVLALFMAAAPSPVRANFRSAVTAYENKDFETAHREFQALARGGDPAAQYFLGMMFKDGLGVRKDTVAALGWFFCAAGSRGRFDHDAGAEAAEWIEQITSSLNGAAIRKAQEKALDCRAMAKRPARSGSREISRHARAASRVDWQASRSTLGRIIDRILGVEVPAPDIGALPDPTAAFGQLRFSLESIVVVPDRGTLWSKAFFLPADGTIVGSQHVAWGLGADDFLEDLRTIAQDRDFIPMAIFAALWWLLIGKTLFSIGGTIVKIYRGLRAE